MFSNEDKGLDRPSPTEKEESTDLLIGSLSWVEKPTTDQQILEQEDKLHRLSNNVVHESIGVTYSSLE